MYCRSDTCRILIDGYDRPWVSSRGGEVIVTTSNTALPKAEITDLIILRYRQDESVLALAELMGRVGHVGRITIEHMSPQGQPTGSGFVYEGEIAKVIPAQFDANSSDVAMDQLVLSPTSVKPLSESETWDMKQHDSTVTLNINTRLLSEAVTRYTLQRAARGPTSLQGGSLVG